MSLLLEARNISKVFTSGGFGQQQRTVAVDRVTLNLSSDTGSIVALAGESGSGKTTLGRILLGLETPTEGEVLYRGNNLTKLGRQDRKTFRREVQAIFQDPFSSLNPRMLVGDIIQEPLDLHTNLSEKEKREKVTWLLEKVGLSAEQATRYPHEFSGGQRQRIGIARSLATEPKVIIADEPVSALDVSIQAQVINLMMDLQDEFDLTILFIAHDLSVVNHISTEIAVMYLGEVVEYNTTEKIFNNPQHQYTKTLLAAIPQPNPDGRDERIKKRQELNS